MEFRRYRDISIRSPHTRGDHRPPPPQIGTAEFQSAPLIRGETSRRTATCPPYRISIRSPHTRGDVNMVRGITAGVHFNPLPSYEGRPGWGGRRAYGLCEFQSAPLIRGETKVSHCPPPSCTISIRSPHTRGDRTRADFVQFPTIFQSAPLIRGETRLPRRACPLRRISIRSPHTRGDDDERIHGRG